MSGSDNKAWRCDGDHGRQRHAISRDLYDACRGRRQRAADWACRTPPEIHQRHVMPLLRLRSLLGLLLLIGVCWALSRNRKAIQWRLVAWGLGLQMIFGIVVLLTPVGGMVFGRINELLLDIMRFSEAGSSFLFGDLIFNNIPVGSGTAGGNSPIDPSANMVARTGAYFAFHVLPTIVFFSSLMAVLYYLRIMQRVVHAVAWAMHRTMGTSGAETIASAGSIFFGLMEAPLLVRPYLGRMTRSELFAVMTAGLATVSGGVLLAYVGMLSPFFPNIGAHLISASVMSAPAALAVAKLMLPETEAAETARSLPTESEARGDVNLIDAAGRGAVEGMFLALKVGAMLIAFLALLAMLNAAFGWLARTLGFGDLTIQAVLGRLLAPVAYMVGIPWAEAPAVGELIGVKTILNEFVAFRELAQNMAGPAALTERSAILASYALAGFANFGSIAMLIAGIGELAPDKRPMLAEMGIRALIGGAIAALMTASVAGILLP